VSSPAIITTEVLIGHINGTTVAVIATTVPGVTA